MMMEQPDEQQHQQDDESGCFASTTAPGKRFRTRSELQAHYRSDWHRYNLKRRQAGLPMLLEPDFEARLQAANALLRDKKEKGRDHLKKPNAGSNKKNKKKNGGADAADNGGEGGDGVHRSSQAAAYDRIKEEQQQQQQEGGRAETTNTKDDEDAAKDDNMEASAEADRTTEEEEQQQQKVDEPPIEIDPRQCLFDRHKSVSVSANCDRMQRKYGFFLPDREYLSDLEGLVGYCHEKIKLGQMCLYCHRVFGTWQGCQKHMIAKQHCKLKYEYGVDLEDLEVFYDFQSANREFLKGIGVDASTAMAATTTSTKGGGGDDSAMEVEGMGEEDGGEEDGWEDISDDEADGDDAMEEDNEDEDMADEYEEQVAARMGFEVTALGELVLPDGRIIGHRELRRYYKQRLRPREATNEAVEAARQGARERLYGGRVYSLQDGKITTGGSGSDAADQQAALALSRAGIAPGAASGRASKGILTNISQVSVYRFRAAIRKQRAGEQQRQRHFGKTRMPINKMDKKANQLKNGVIVPKAPR